MNKLLYILLIPILAFSQISYKKDKNNIVYYDADKEKTHATWAAFDTSSYKIWFTPTGKSMFEMYNQVGNRIFWVDSVGVSHADSMATGIFYYSGANYADSLNGTGFKKDIDAWFNTNGILTAGIGNTQVTYAKLVQAVKDSLASYASHLKVIATNPHGITDNTVTSAKILDGEIVNNDINTSAAIAGTKVSPNFGSQNVVTTGSIGIGQTNPTARLELIGIGSSSTTSGLLIKNSTGATLLHVLDNGHIGINKNTPETARMVISGISTSSASACLDVQTSNGNSYIYARDDGFIGFGTTAPAAKLDVLSGNILLSNNQSVQFKNVAGDIKNILKVSSDDNTYLRTTAADKSVNIGNTSGSPLMTVLDGGNVGIGTTNPTSKLHVSGGGMKADSVSVGAGGVWMRNWYYNAADTSLRVIYYNSTLARLDTVKMANVK